MSNITNNLWEILKPILAIVLPTIRHLIESQVVPRLKRKGYETVNNLVDTKVADLAQNVGKIKNETDSAKKTALIEGSKLGIEFFKALGEKLIQVAQTLEKEIQGV